MTSPTITTLSTTQGLLAAVRAACCLLNQAPDEVSAVTVAGDLEPGSTALPVLARAESLGREFGCSVLMHLAHDRYEIRFSRTSADAPQ
jgi:hypothetical protein